MSIQRNIRLRWSRNNFRVRGYKHFVPTGRRHRRSIHYYPLPSHASIQNWTAKSCRMQINMKGWLKKLQVSHSQRKLRSLARWELVRAKGKRQFVLRGALTYSLLMIPARDFVDYLVDGKMQPWSERFWTDTIVYCITGVVVGLVSWSSLERKYENALLEHRIAAAEINPNRS